MPIDIADPTRLPKDFCIFFCWQDHLDKKLHRFLIRDALNAAIGKVQAEMPPNIDCVLRQDSDTMDRAGTVDIANSILQKINQSVVVIGDVTPALCVSDERLFYPNPNVMLELGYAAKTVGWSRVICLFNEASCTPSNLPFDIRHRRVTPYSCKDVSQKAQAAKALESIIYNSLRAILQEIGRGEFDPTIGDTAVKHQRDLRLLRQLMGTIHRATLDAFIERGLHYQLHDNCNYFYIGFNAILRSSSFRFYDKELEKRAIELLRVWSAAVHYGGNAFFPGRFPNSYVLKDDHHWDANYRKTVNAMLKAYKALPAALNGFLDHVHEQFPEIDMTETDTDAWKANLPYITGSICSEKEDKKSPKKPTKRKQ